MKLHIVIHEVFEAPAAIKGWAQNKGHEVIYTHLSGGDILPDSVDGFDYLIVMGGPQSPATTKEECPHYDAQAEMQLIKKAVDADKFVLGVCLGAQLIGEALGAKHEHSPQREIGVYEMKLTEDAKDDPIFSQFPESFLCGHWHGDMPGLTPEAKILATSEGCPRQIVKYAPKVYGFQCHFEFTPEAIECMIQNSIDELEEHKDLPYVQSAEELRNNNYTEINNRLFQFLDAMEAMYNNQ